MSLETGQILQDIGLSATISQLWGKIGSLAAIPSPRTAGGCPPHARGGVPTPPEASPHARGGVGRGEKRAPLPGSDVRLLLLLALVVARNSPGPRRLSVCGAPLADSLPFAMAAAAQAVMISRVTVDLVSAGSTLPLSSATRSASRRMARTLGSGTIPPITESVVSQASSDGRSRPRPSPSIVRRAVRTASP